MGRAVVHSGANKIGPYTFGNRSESGVLNHNVLMSVLQTAKLHKQDGWEILHQIITLPSAQRTLKIVTGARAP